MLNERIRSLRLAKGLTLQQIGDAFGISRASVSAWESGVAKPDAAKLVRLAQILETSLSNLMGEAIVEQLSCKSEDFASSVPFIRWDLIEKNSFAHNPSQNVKVNYQPLPEGAFATRLIAPADWAWRPGPIPAGSILIINPTKTPRACKINLIAPRLHAMQLARFHKEKSLFESSNFLENEHPLILNGSEVRVVGEVIEWQLNQQIIC